MESRKQVYRIKQVSGELKYGICKIEPGCSAYLTDTNDEVVNGGNDYSTEKEALNALMTYKSYFKLLKGCCGYFYYILEYYVVQVELDESGEEIDWLGGRSYAEFDKLSNDQIIDILESNGISYLSIDGKVYATLTEIDEDGSEYEREDDLSEMTYEEINEWIVNAA